jgi:hypothetical protein
LKLTPTIGVSSPAIVPCIGDFASSSLAGTA